MASAKRCYRKKYYSRSKPPFPVFQQPSKKRKMEEQIEKLKRFLDTSKRMIFKKHFFQEGDSSPKMKSRGDESPRHFKFLVTKILKSILNQHKIPSV